PGRLDQSYDCPGIEDRFPAKPLLHAFEQRADALLALIGYGPVAIHIERKLFVLGANAPLALWFAALRNIVDEFVDGSYGLAVSRIARHVFLRLTRAFAVRRNRPASHNAAKHVVERSCGASAWAHGALVLA